MILGTVDAQSILRIKLLKTFVKKYKPTHERCIYLDQGAQYLTGENLEVVWAKFSCLR